MTINSPKLPLLKTIIDRLPLIFPEGTEKRNDLIREMAASEKTSHVLVKFPNGEVRRMSAGPSSILSKCVIKLFTKLFFLTAFFDRGEQVYRRLSSDIAWGSLVWFASEPENIIILKDKEELTKKSIFDIL